MGVILDCAAEADVNTAPRSDHGAHPDCLGEVDCDANAAIIVSSIDAAAAAAKMAIWSRLPHARSQASDDQSSSSASLILISVGGGH